MITVASSASLQSHGATALTYQQSLSHSNGIYDVPQLHATQHRAYPKQIASACRHVWSEDTEFTIHVKRLDIQLMCQLAHCIQITHGVGSRLTGKVLETLADGDGTSWFPSGTAAVKPAVQNP